MTKPFIQLSVNIVQENCKVILTKLIEKHGILFHAKYEDGQ